MKESQVHALKILVIGPNLTYQQTHLSKGIKRGDINRLEKTVSFPSGKGVNVVRALNELGHDGTLLTLSGGHLGKKMESDLLKEGIHFQSVPMKNEARVCFTILDQKAGTTELIGSNPQCTDQEAGNFLRLLQEKLEAPFDSIIFTGTSPELEGGQELQKAIYMKLAQSDRFIVYDQSSPLLKEAPLAKKHLVKINEEEFIKIFPVESAQKESLLNLKDLNICVTRGARESTFLYQGKVYEISPPNLEKMVNPIGAGDVACACLTILLSLNEEPQSALKKALHYATESCKTLIPGDFKAYENPLL